MKIAVTATGPGLDEEVHPLFGRCPCHLYVDSEDLSFEVVDNPLATLPACPGVRVARRVIDHGAKVVLTGNCKGNTYLTLKVAGVQVFVDLKDLRVREAVERFKAGGFSPPTKEQVTKSVQVRTDEVVDSLEQVRKRIQELEAQVNKS